MSHSNVSRRLTRRIAHLERVRRSCVNRPDSEETPAKFMCLDGDLATSPRRALIADVPCFARRKRGRIGKSLRMLFVRMPPAGLSPEAYIRE